MTHFLAQQGRVKLIWHRQETRCGLSHAVRSLAANAHTLSLIHLDPKVLAISAKEISRGLKGKSLKWYRVEIKLAWKRAVEKQQTELGRIRRAAAGWGSFMRGCRSRSQRSPLQHGCLEFSQFLTHLPPKEHAET